MKQAGFAAKYFGCNPADILDGSLFRFAVTMAAYNYVSEVEEQQAAKREAQRKAGQTR